MADILKIVTGQSAGRQVAAARPLPGFLIEPSEEETVNRLLAKLFDGSSGNREPCLAELIDNTRMME